MAINLIVAYIQFTLSSLTRVGDCTCIYLYLPAFTCVYLCLTYTSRCIFHSHVSFSIHSFHLTFQTFSVGVNDLCLTYQFFSKFLLLINSSIGRLSDQTTHKRMCAKKHTNHYDIKRQRRSLAFVRSRCGRQGRSTRDRSLVISLNNIFTQPFILNGDLLIALTGALAISSPHAQFVVRAGRLGQTNMSTNPFISFNIYWSRVEAHCCFVLIGCITVYVNALYIYIKVR